MTSQKNIQEFNKIYDKTYNNVLKYVIVKCSNLDDVNDIVQDIYLEVYKKLNNVDINYIDKYIFGIAKNKIKKYYGLLYKLKNFSLFNSDDKEILDNVPSLDDIEKIVIDNYDLEVIWGYLSSKKVIIGKIFYLFYVVGFTIKEISLELSVSESYVKNSIYRTLKELKEVMEE